MRRQALVVVVLLAALALLAPPATVRAGETTTVHDVASELLCQCGCALTVATCQESMGCSVASSIVDEIERQIAAGNSKGEIQAYFASVYGEMVLALPKKSGFTLTAWTIPFAGVGAGAVVLSLLVWWCVRSRPPAGLDQDAAPAAHEELSRYEQQLDRDLMHLGDEW